MGEINFPWEKTALFYMIYNFTITITRIHFTICKVRSSNLNPGGGFIFNREVVNISKKGILQERDGEKKVGVANFNKTIPIVEDII